MVFYVNRKTMYETSCATATAVSGVLSLLSSRAAARSNAQGGSAIAVQNRPKMVQFLSKRRAFLSIFANFYEFLPTFFTNLRLCVEFFAISLAHLIDNLDYQILAF